MLKMLFLKTNNIFTENTKEYVSISPHGIDC